MTSTDDIRSTSQRDLRSAERRVLFLTNPIHLLTHFSILVFPAVTIPITRTLDMPLEDAVRLSFLMYLTYGLGSLPVGYLADRWQARKLLLFGVFAMGAGLILAGITATATAMPWCLMLVGIGASVYHPAGMALITHTVERRGESLAINGVFGSIGIMAAPFATGILTWAFSWQWAFIIIGAITSVTGLALCFVRVDETPHPVHEGRAQPNGDLVKLFFVLCIPLVLGGLSYRGNTVLLPAYLELKTVFFSNAIETLSFMKDTGTRTLAATLLTSLVFVAGIFGQLIGGRIADRYDLRYAYLAFHAAAVPFLLAMAFTSDVVLVACAAMYAFFSIGMQPIENSLVAALTPAKWRSTGFAMKFVLTFGVGALAVPLVGYVKAQYSLETVYVVLAGIALALVFGIIGLIVASRTTPHIRN